MTDVHTKKQRSYNMSCIRSRETKPEIILKKFLDDKGFAYQPDLYGKPDFVNFDKKVVLFVDGCFWHKCPKCFVTPSTNKGFWEKKIDGNVLRDKEINHNYLNSRWKVIRIWEHLLKQNPILVYNLILKKY